MTKLIERISLYLDFGARWVAAGLMAVITVNVILRMFGQPLKGIVEYVQLLTALSIGLGLANCAVQGGHIAITFFTDKLPEKVQGLLRIIIDGLVALFLGTTAWYLFQYGNGMKQSGEIGLATGIVIYPFVYVVAVGFAVHLLVVLLEIGKTLQNMFTAKKVSKPVCKEAVNSDSDVVLDL